MISSGSSAHADDQRAVRSRADFRSLLARLHAKDRSNVERHMEACEAESDPRHGDVWRRLASFMGSLASATPETQGQQVIRFFIPDGKYRQQVFAIQDHRDGMVSVVMGDILDEARQAKLLRDNPTPAEPTNTLLLENGETLNVQYLDSGMNNPQPFYKAMLGWNRRAIRVDVPVNASDAQLQAVEDLCALSAKRWGASR